MIGLMIVIITGVLCSAAIAARSHVSRQDIPFVTFCRGVTAFSSFAVAYSAWWILAARNYSDDVNIGCWSIGIMFASITAKNIYMTMREHHGTKGQIR